jgi:pimeloyl-ACP methyl ester carboxylesterase
VFTAPGFGNTSSSTDGESGCPPQPPLEVQLNTSGYPTQAGQSVLGFLGFLNETYGYETFDLVGYSYGGIVAQATVAALKASELSETAPGQSWCSVQPPTPKRIRKAGTPVRWASLTGWRSP